MYQNLLKHHDPLIREIAENIERCTVSLELLDDRVNHGVDWRPLFNESLCGLKGKVDDLTNT